MSETTQKILLLVVVAPAVFIISLVVGAYWTFPYDHVRDFVVQEVERGGTVQLEIGSLEPSWVTGIELRDVRATATPTDPNREAGELAVRQANARVSLLSLLGGTTEVDFDAEVGGGGRVAGVFAQGAETTQLDAEITNLDLRRVGIIRDTAGLPIAGRVAGEVDLTVGREAANTQGEARITIRGLRIGDGETPLQVQGLSSGLTLEPLELGTLNFRLDVERGTGSVEELHADGEHAEFRGTGSIRLAQPLARSAVDMLVRIRFKDAYRESSPRMDALLALLGSNPQVAPARRDDGSLQWRVQGSFGGRVRMVPNRNATMPDAD